MLSAVTGSVAPSRRCPTFALQRHGRDRLFAFGDLSVELPESDSRHSAAEVQSLHDPPEDRPIEQLWEMT